MCPLSRLPNSPGDEEHGPSISRRTSSPDCEGVSGWITLQEIELILVGLSMAFVTLLVVANIIAVKLIAIGGWVVPAGIVAYPFTFLVSDTIAELYGRKTTTRIVWLGFVFSLLMLALVYLAKVWPAAGIWDAQSEYDRILGSVPRIVLGSTVAYLISQHHDVIAFHIWRRVTRGRHLWLRNNASTVVSQAIDTLLFVPIALGGTVPASVLWNMIGTQYVAKVVISVLDTPLVYALVGAVRRYGDRIETPALISPSAQPASDDAD